MRDVKVYDKVKWHLEKGATLENATLHFKVLLEWLKEQGFLTPTGEELYQFGIDSEFSLTSDLVTSEVKQILDDHYVEWLKTFDYGERPSLEVFKPQTE